MFNFGENMKTISQVEKSRVAASSESGFAVETTFVLFFLAIEFGLSFRGFGMESSMMAITLLALIVMPYFLPSNDKPAFGSWVLGRLLITAFAVLLGVMFRQSLGVILPEMFRFLPMTLLIITAMAGCYIQFYGFFKLRLAK
jgi:hypothetical protein